MAEDKNYFGEKLRLVECAREDAYFRKLDQTLGVVGFPGESEKFCTLDTLSWRPQWS